MLQDQSQWRRLLAEYAQLRHLKNGLTPQARGRRFNGMIADLLRVFGIAAKANQLSVGELDVTFRHAGRPFILEAKWEQRKVGTGPVAKLQRRVEQRMVGVIGVFLSMEGYSPDALAEIDKGRRLDLVLLDRSHWEAMLSGFVPPPELLDLVTDAASFGGNAYTPLTALLDPKAPDPMITFESPPMLDGDIQDHGAAVIRTNGVLRYTESTQMDIALDRERLMLTMPQGIASVDLAGQTAVWAAPLSGCSGSPLPLSDGSILVARAYGVGRYYRGEVTAVSGGAGDVSRCQLLANPDGSFWCFDMGIMEGETPSPPALTRIGSEVGDEHWTDTPVAPADIQSAFWLSSQVLVAVRSSELLILPLSGVGIRTVVIPDAGVSCVLPIDESRLLAIAADLRVYVIFVATCRHLLIGALVDVDGIAARGAFASDGSAYLVARYRKDNAGTDRGVIRVTAPVGWPSDEGLPSVGIAARIAPAPRTVLSHEQSDAFKSESAALTNVPPLPISPSVTEGVGVADGTGAEIRQKERERGYRAGLSASATLPLYAFESLLSVQFDLVRWLAPWRQNWDDVVAGRPPEGWASLVSWLPGIARYLGSYAAPRAVVESHFTPNPAYVVGFSAGLRAGWERAVHRRLVPANLLSYMAWLREPSRDPTGTPRHLTTLEALQKDASRTRAKLVWSWILRVSVWLAAVFFGTGTIVFVEVVVTGDESVDYRIGGLLFYSVPFLLLLAYITYDMRRFRRSRRNARGLTRRR